MDEKSLFKYFNNDFLKDPTLNLFSKKDLGRREGWNLRGESEKVHRERQRKNDNVKLYYMEK